jgi:hypothetical protein
MNPQSFNLDALVTNTMLCESSRFIYGDSRYRNLHRLIDLSILVEAVVLHDHLYTLESFLPQDDSRLLRRELINAGILEPLKPPQDANRKIIQLADEIVELSQKYILSNQQVVVNKDPYNWSGIHDLITHVCSRTLDVDLPEKDLTLQSSAGATQFFDTDVDGSECLQAMRAFLDGPDPFFKIREKLAENQINDLQQILKAHIGILLRSGQTKLRGTRTSELSGKYEQGITELRSWLYWMVAQEKGIPFYPDIVRLPFTLMFASKVHPFPLSHAGAAAAHRHSTKEISQQQVALSRIKSFSIPPILAGILSIVDSPNEIVPCLVKLHKETRPLRIEIARIMQAEEGGSPDFDGELKIYKQWKSVLARGGKSNLTPVSKYIAILAGAVLGSAIGAISGDALPPCLTAMAGSLIGTAFQYLPDSFYIPSYLADKTTRLITNVAPKVKGMKSYGKLVDKVWKDEPSAFRPQFYDEMAAGITVNHMKGLYQAIGDIIGVKLWEEEERERLENA